MNFQRYFVSSIGSVGVARLTRLINERSFYGWINNDKYREASSTEPSWGVGQSGS